MKIKKTWTIKKHSSESANLLTAELGMSKTVAKILAGRGITSTDIAKKFLNPTLLDIPDPFSLPELALGVERTADAIAKKEKIAIFGDYDADGISGAALLTKFLRSTGAEVQTYLPNRFDGYGLSRTHIAKIAKEGASLLITVDNGTRAIEEAKLAKELGLDLVITDHHAPDVKRPVAIAHINPHLLKGEHAFRGLSGCGVAFMFLLGLRKVLRDRDLLPIPEPNLKQELDLVAIGTIADVMPLTGLNRIFVKFGLASIKEAQKYGIAELLRVASTDPKDVNSSSVAFRLAPRINAVGRIGDPFPALNLLLSEDRDLARELAQELDSANKKRQQLEQKIIASADEMIAAQVSMNKLGIVIAHESWHPGVIGVVASRISESTGLPTVVITKEMFPARGSARAPYGINLVELLASSKSSLVDFGGHSQAAGLSVAHDSIASFTELFNKACEDAQVETRSEEIEIDAIVTTQDINLKLANEISTLEPFGEENPEPILLLESAKVRDKRMVGDSHLKLFIECEGRVIDAIAFRMADRIGEIKETMDIAFCLQKNTWNGNESAQLRVVDLR